uniref:Fe2OG dioxygenase domain-containing protein n=1 Tax=Odontella aurita TaxID=265563 RepID=A0A7S4N4D5_9STRA|mmetsp:Transcript_46965/g.142226  ORF Transcript_46965/g.142226 Transcript_46965/m.142226 type:complete len:317 (+) Transcript_46965:111-1061(+)
MLARRIKFLYYSTLISFQVTCEHSRVAFTVVDKLSARAKVTTSYLPYRSSLFSSADPEAGVKVEKLIRDDYHNYEHSPLKRRYEQAGGVIYRQSVLSPKEFGIMNQMISSSLGRTVRLSEETSSSVATKRIGAQLPADSEIVRILGDENGSFSRMVNSLVNVKGAGYARKMVLSEDVPVEVRIYEKTGSGMEWHVDDVLFDPEQIEIVYTVENDSDCLTIWEEPLPGSEPTIEYKRVEVETARNSAIFLKAGGVRHRVSPLKSGRRVILKFVYVMEGSSFLEDAEQHVKQFASSKQQKKLKTRRDRKKNDRHNRKK